MNFQRGRHRDEPEINFIPLIDLLLVVLIFLVVSTTYARFPALKLSLPESNGASETPAHLQEIKAVELAVTAQDHYQIGAENLAENQHAELLKLLKNAHAGDKNAVLFIHADALATHRSVVMALDAAGQAGFQQIRFVTKKAS